MQRLIVTGANGSGKSHLATRLAKARPDIPVISFDGLKLRQDWQQRPRSEIEADLASIIRRESWILEGGPSLLPLALGHAQGVIWLDPPERVRAWRLGLRPLRNFGKTRPELPPGNQDWPVAQYRFALRSLKAGAQFRDNISKMLNAAQDLTVWHCKRQSQIDAAVADWQADVLSQGG